MNVNKENVNRQTNSAGSVMWKLHPATGLRI
jgi:hypothetical protein